MVILPINYLSSLHNIEIDKEVREKGVICLNDKNSFKLSTVGKGASARIGVFGGTGSGKTYLDAIIMNQFPDEGGVIFLDPQNRFDIVLRAQDQLHKWDFYAITEIFKPQVIRHKNLRKRTMKLQINACELNERAATVYAKNRADKKLKNTLKKFCQLKKELRTYANLRLLCKKNKAMDLFNELKFILHPHDLGISLDELSVGKKVIDISTLTGQDRVVGVLIESILGHRALAKDREHLPLLVAIDECQRYCNGNQEIGAAIGGLCTTGRVFNIFVLISGIVPRKLNTMIKGSLNIFFIFRLLQNDLEELVNYNIRLYPEDFEEFPKIYDAERDEYIIRGWCFYFNIEAGMNDVAPLNFNLYFRQFERKMVQKVQVNPISFKKTVHYGTKFNDLRRLDLNLLHK